MEAGTKPLVRLRAMTADDLPAARELSREQNWPHRSADWAFLFDIGQGIVAESDGAVVGTAMCWIYEGAATIGMVIVSPACQGQGIGRRMMNSLLETLGDRTVMLHATDEGLSLYKSLGFVPLGQVFQHQGAVFAVPIPELQAGERVRPMGSRDVDAACDLDRQATGMQRDRVIATLCDVSQGVVLARADEPAGFALFRRFGRGYVIGPTIAPDLDGAKALISHWLGSNAGMFCRLDVADDSGLSVWLDELGLPCVGRVTRMVRGEPLAVTGPGQTYSLINQALR